MRLPRISVTGVLLGLLLREATAKNAAPAISTAARTHDAISLPTEIPLRADFNSMAIRWLALPTRSVEVERTFSLQL